jgi:hypothetical protein
VPSLHYRKLSEMMGRTTNREVTVFSTFRNTALAAVAVGLALTSSAHADFLLFQWVSGSETASWEQQSNPTPFSSGVVDTQIGVLNGTETTVAHGTESFTNVLFFTLGIGGGFDTINVSTGGPQLFTGTTSSPIFSPQTVNLINLGPGGGAGILTVTDTSVPAPEPASLPLLVIGLAGLGMVVRRRRA